MKSREKLFTQIGLSPAEQKVYSSMLDGVIKVGDIQKHTGMKRPTIYYSLKQLEQLGLVVKTSTNQVTRYSLGPLEQLRSLAEKKKEDAEKLFDEADSFVTSYLKPQNSPHVLVTHFETIESVKQSIMFSLFAKNKKILTIVPRENFFEKSDQIFRAEYVSQKKKRGIKTQALWAEIPSEKVTKEYYQSLDVKKLPTNMEDKFKTTVFIYDNKVLYIFPSVTRPHSILIESSEQGNLMKAMFDQIYEME